MIYIKPIYNSKNDGCYKNGQITKPKSKNYFIDLIFFFLIFDVYVK